MMIQSIRSLALVVACATAAPLSACSGSGDGSEGPDPMTTDEDDTYEGGEVLESGVRDVSPTPPEVVDDVMRIELAEQRVEAGDEVEICHYLEPMAEDKFLVTFDQYQGLGGHHLLAFRTLEQKPAGTVEPCSSASEEMAATLIPMVFSSGFVTVDFPEGMAVRVAAGEQVVIQQHYVNTSPTALVSRDVADFTFIPADEVATELGFYAISDPTFVIPPVSEHTITIGCEADMDMSWILAGPHMHETGKHLKVTHESGGDTTTLIEVEDWEDDFRDLPPVADFGTAPVEIKTGDMLTLDCTFENDTGEEIGFPREMCAVYGYFFPGDETSLWGCTLSGIIRQ